MKGAEFKILGPLEVVAGGQVVDLGSPKQRAVLAILALEPNKAVSVDRLVDQLWGEDPPASALGSLHAYISNLRRILEPDRSPRAAARVIVSRAPGYLLSVNPERLDSLRFEQFVRAGAERLREGDAGGAIAELEAGLGLWRGAVLEDFAYETFVVPVREHLEELRRNAIEDLIDARLDLGQHQMVIAELEQLVRDAPLRERAWAQLVVALYRSGRQADALRAYQRASTVLVEELGLDPGPDLRRLEQAVIEQDPQLDWTPPHLVDATGQPPAVTGAYEAEEPEGTGGSLPIGRTSQLEQIDQLVALLGKGHGGVVLVSGEPGVGKTTLLSELARRARSATCTVGWGEFNEGGSGLPLDGWADALRGVSAGTSPLDLQTLLDADVRGQPPTVARMLEQALDHIRAVVAHGSVVLVLDDIQWADELSHHLLAHVVRATGTLPLLLALGVRDPVDDASAALLATRATLARLPNLERLELRGLDQAEVDALTQRVAGGPAAPDVLEAIYERTGGNPFFVTELARLLSAQHALADAHIMSSAGVPVGARDVVRRRLARLPEQAVVVLGVASAIAPDIDLRLLERMTGIGVDELLDLMDLATVASLVSEHPEQPGSYRFCHALVREAIYDSLAGLRQARLHERAIGALLDLHGEDPGIAHELAAHAVRAVPSAGPDQAFPRLLASARLAQVHLSMDLAESQLRLGLSLLSDLPSTPERRVFEAEFASKLAQIQFLVRCDGDEARTSLQRAYDSCANDDAARLAVVLQQGTLMALLGDVDASVAAADDATSIARSLGDEQAESDSDYCRAFGAWSGDLPSAMRAIDASIAVAQALEQLQRLDRGVHVPLACKLGWRTVLASLDGDEQTLSAEGREAIAMAMRVSGIWGLSWTAAFVALGAAIRGDVEDVLRLWPEVAEQSAGVGYTDTLLEACRAWATAAESATSDLSDLARARAAQTAAGAGLTLVPLAALEADLRQRSSDAEGAAGLLDAARQQATRRGHTLWLPELDRISGNTAVLRGDLVRGAELLTAAATAAEEARIGLFARRARHDLDALAPRLVDTKSP